MIKNKEVGQRSAIRKCDNEGEERRQRKRAMKMQPELHASEQKSDLLEHLLFAKGNYILDLYLNRKSAVMNLRNLGHFVRFIKDASIFFCYIHVTKTYLIEAVSTYGPSMLPAIDLTTSVFLMEKICTRFSKVDRGDIVVLRDPRDPRRKMTKRVVGLEGDRVTYNSNPETYELEGDNFTHTSYPDNNDKLETIVVPKGGVWVEGDNKYNSNDSRKFGPVPFDLIQGRIFWRISPLKYFGPFWHK